MKASAITLVHKDAPYRALRTQVAAAAAASGTAPKAAVPYLVNLVDSPGHVDFSADVSTAVRVADGAIVVVDVVEGVCIQTHAVLKQAWEDGVTPCLVLNKLDRLVTELGMTPAEAYTRMQRVLEHINVVASSLLTSRQMEEAEEDGGAAVGTDAAAAQERALFFAPAKGNVVFASAHAGWAFSLDDFAVLLAEKLGAPQAALRKHLWGPWAWKKATSEFVALKEGSKRAPLFVDCVLAPIWRTYAAAQLRPSLERMQKVVAAFGLTLPEGALAHPDGATRVKAIMRAWLPLARAVLSMVARSLPSPAEAQAARVDVLLGPPAHREAMPGAPPAVTERRRAIAAAVSACDASDDVPAVVFITKLLALPAAAGDAPPPAPETHCALPLGEAARADVAVAAGLPGGGDAGVDDVVDALDEQHGEAWGQLRAAHAGCSERFLAFGRVYAGTVRPGQRLWVVDGGTPGTPPPGAPLCLAGVRAVAVETHVTPYMMMGRAVFPVPAMPAGNILALGGLDASLVKHASLSTSPLAPAFAAMPSQSTPLLKVTVAPRGVAALPALQRGLQLLNQADPCVGIGVAPDGQLQLAAVGELHLATCVEDLVKRFAGVPVDVSPPVLAFRETIVAATAAPSVQAAGAVLAAAREAAEAAAAAPGTEAPPAASLDVPPAIPGALPCVGAGVVGVSRTVGGAGVTWDGATGCLRVAAPVSMEGAGSEEGKPTLTLWLHLAPVPEPVADAVEAHRGALTLAGDGASRRSPAELAARLAALEALEDAALSEEVLAADSEWAPRVQTLLAAVPGGGCLLTASGAPELLPGAAAGAAGDTAAQLARDPRCLAGLVEGFRLAARGGPLTAEPLHRVGVDVAGIALALPGGRAPPLSALVRAAADAMRAGVHYGVALHGPRLVEPLYRAELQCSGGRSGGGEQLGNLHGVLAKRRGTTTGTDIIPGTTTFHIQCLLPVAESLGFAQDLRAATSGAASAPQMMFSHWALLAQDPFDTGEEDTAGADMSGTAAHMRNVARRCMDGVRRRKGLRTHDKVVVHAEKQRTLARKK